MNNADTQWTWLYKIAAAAALLFVVFLPIQILVFFVSPPPDSVSGWFALFQNNRLFGLLDLDLLLIVDQVLTMVIFLALYVALRETSESLMAVGLVIGLVSTVLFIASNPAFAMLSLSDQHAAAATDAQRDALLAAGQAVMVSWQGSAFQASYFLGSVAPILMSAVMLRSPLFSKAAAILGIVANVIAFGLYVPQVGVYISIFSVVFLWAWILLIGLRFFSLGRPAKKLLQLAES